MMKLSTVAWLLVSAAALACRPDVSRAEREGNQGSEGPANGLADRAEGVHALPGPPDATLLVVVLEPEGVLCEQLAAMKSRDFHLLCDVEAEADPHGRRLRRAMERQKRGSGRNVAPPVILLGAEARAGDVRALVSQDAEFFARAAVWTGGSSGRVGLFGPTFLTAAGAEGAQRFFLVGDVEPEVSAPWITLAQRVGLIFRVLGPDAGAGEVLSALRDDPPGDLVRGAPGPSPKD